MSESVKDRAVRALHAAQSIAPNCRTWVELHNALFGLGGVCPQLFTSESDRIEFSRTPQFGEIHACIDRIRLRDGDPSSLALDLATANGRILVRVPRSLHAALLAEARAEGVSLNQLCMAKLCTHLRAATVVMPAWPIDENEYAPPLIEKVSAPV